MPFLAYLGIWGRAEKPLYLWCRSTAVYLIASRSPWSGDHPMKPYNPSPPSFVLSALKA
jgi:hypothetical protein